MILNEKEKSKEKGLTKCRRFFVFLCFIYREQFYMGGKAKKFGLKDRPNFTKKIMEIMKKFCV